uniref:JmjC domain-containing protein n=1 Tax=Alexandrium monilatum TaxID=311494 RepID=A0A7S4Q0S4_9DINO
MERWGLGTLFWASCCLQSIQLARPAPSPELEVCAAPGGECPVDSESPGVGELLGRLFNRSYLVFRGAVPQDKVARAVRAMQRPRWSFGAMPGGAQRVMEVLELDPVFAEMIAELPEDIVQIADKVLAESWQLGSLHGHVLYPEERVLTQAERDGKGRGALHSDFPYGHATAEFGGNLTSIPEQFPYTLQLIWMLSPFTATSGSTLIFPGSHVNRTLLRDRFEPGLYETFVQNAAQVTGSPGDIILYIGQAQHLWGVNEANHTRMAILGQVLPFFFKHMESHVMKTPEYVVRRMPPLARYRLGFSRETWFKHPKRLLPFPRSPLEGAECLLDMLLVGYHGPMDLEGTIKKFKDLPEGRAELLVLAASFFFQLNRFSAVLVLIAPMLLWGCAACRFRCCCCRCTCGKRCGFQSLSGALRDSLLILLGMIFGITLLMDRLSL